MVVWKLKKVLLVVISLETETHIFRISVVTDVISYIRNSVKSLTLTEEDFSEGKLTLIFVIRSWQTEISKKLLSMFKLIVFKNYKIYSLHQSFNHERYCFGREFFGENQYFHHCIRIRMVRIVQKVPVVSIYLYLQIYASLYLHVPILPWRPQSKTLQSWRKIQSKTQVSWSLIRISESPNNSKCAIDIVFREVFFFSNYRNNFPWSRCQRKNFTCTRILITKSSL